MFQAIADVVSFPELCIFSIGVVLGILAASVAMVGAGDVARASRGDSK